MRHRSAIFDWILASDPALSRARMGARVTLSILLSAAVLALVHVFIVPLPQVAYGLIVVLSIEGGVAVKDRSPREQLKTRLLGAAASFACVSLSALLEGHRYISDLTFLLVIFLSAVARVYGQRGFAIGMFAFTSYFMGAYLRPTLTDLPLALLGPATAIVMGHLIRTYVIVDDWRRDLLQALIAIDGRVSDILLRLAVTSSAGHVSDQDQRDLRQLEERLKDVALMAEGFLPRPGNEALGAGNEPAMALAMKIFDAHLAAESAIVLSLEAPAPFVLVHALIEGDEALARRVSEGPAVTADNRVSETARALLWLGEARNNLADAIREGEADHFRAIDEADTPAAPVRPDFSLKNPTIRMALQILFAAAIAMAFGLALSRDRWFWAVLTSFIIFSNTKSRGDAALRALQRSIGTVLGIALGLVLATLLSGHPFAILPLAALSIFFAFYFLQVSYASLTFFVSIVLCLVYGLLGTLTLDVLLLRVEETMIGALAGTIAAFVVFPAPTRSQLDLNVTRWFDGLRQLLVAAREGKSNFELIELSRKLDAMYRDVTVAARPLGTSWAVVTKPGEVRQTLAIFLGATYWARIFARYALRAETRPQGEVLAAINDALRQIDALQSRGAECFSIKRKTARGGGRHLPIFNEGSRVGVEMIGNMLSRLYPEKPAEQAPEPARNPASALR